MSAETVRVSPAWLGLREAADGAARAVDLVEQLRPHLPAGGGATIHDLGCGTGSMGRWLAPRLTGRQHWVLYDRDADLLAHAAATMPAGAADGAVVTVETRQRDVTRLDQADLAGASLITASALLDMLTADELERFVTTCARAGCPVLITISVIGRVDLRPADPYDAHIAGAFNAHQRRTTGGRRLLGPDAVGAAADAFTRLGMDVAVRPSPWLLDADQAALTGEWFRGWVAAAFEQQPGLALAAAGYARSRAAEATAGRLSVRVHHHDLMAWPR
jgi:SAM-dependent methyltransferase